MKGEVVNLSLKCVKNSENRATSLTPFVCLNLSLRSEKQVELPDLSILLKVVELWEVIGCKINVFTSNWTETITFLSFK